MIDIIRARLLRGAGMKVGELQLILAEVLTVIDRMEAEIEELKKELNAKPRRGGGRSQKSADAPEVSDGSDE